MHSTVLVRQILHLERVVLSSSITKQLQSWALTSLGSTFAPSPRGMLPVAGDASNRRYFRLYGQTGRYVLAYAPPATENNEAFVQVRNILAAADVRVPALYAVDMKRGFFLLEDLGDRQLLPELQGSTVDGYYQHALGILCRLAESGSGDALPTVYDERLLCEELGRFLPWFVQGLLDYAPNPAEETLLQTLFHLLTDSALEQPQVLVHRDFHSRNLMIQDDGSLAVIDFQDAVRGPITYDPVSLLRDCYIRWPRQRVRSWALGHAGALRQRGLLAADDQQFLRWFDWLGLQRHIKVLGTFARLAQRDSKYSYLDDLPLVLGYVREVLEHYAPRQPVFADVLQWWRTCLQPRIDRQSWSSPR